MANFQLTNFNKPHSKIESYGCLHKETTFWLKQSSLTQTQLKVRSRLLMIRCCAEPKSEKCLWAIQECIVSCWQIMNYFIIIGVVITFKRLASILIIMVQERLANKDPLSLSIFWSMETKTPMSTKYYSALKTAI